MDTNSQIVQVRVENIIPNRYQPRLNFKEEELNELANSIRQYGVIQPLILRKYGNKYEIIAGERRYKASIMAGLQVVPALVNEIDDKTSAELALVENIHRQDLSAIEEAKSYKRLLDLGKFTQEQLAERMGKKQSTIANKMRLLNLPQSVQDALVENRISERHARSLLQISDPNKQQEFLNKIINERLTVKATDELIKKYKSEHSDDYLPDLQDFKNKEINNANDLADKDIINLDALNNPDLNSQNVFSLRNGEDDMNNQQSSQMTYDNIPKEPEVAPVVQEPVKPVEQGPVPVQQPMFNNNFFPPLDEQTANMGLNNNLWGQPIAENPLGSSNLANNFPTNNPNPQAPLDNPWFTSENQIPDISPSSTNPLPSQQLNIVNPNLTNSPQPQVVDQNPWFQEQPFSNIQEEVNTTVPSNGSTTPDFVTTPHNQTFPAGAINSATPELANQSFSQSPWFNDVNSAPPTQSVSNNQPVNQTLGSTLPTAERTMEQNPWFSESGIPSNSVVSTQPSPELINSQPYPSPNNSQMINSTIPANPWFQAQPQSGQTSNDFIDFNPNIPQNPMSNMTSGYDKKNLTDVVNQIRMAIATVESMGYKIITNELDLENEYQFVVKIQKDTQNGNM